MAVSIKAKMPCDSSAKSASPRRARRSKTTRRARLLAVEPKLPVATFPAFFELTPILLPEKLLDVTLDILSQPKLKQITLSALLQRTKHRLHSQSRISTHKLRPLLRRQAIE